MNKKTVLTILVCAQLLITPQLHAWEMPKNLDGKQIGIIATVAAALVTLIGIACYAYKKKGVAAQAGNSAGDAQAKQGDERYAQLIADIRKTRESEQKIAKEQAEARDKELEALKKDQAELKQIIFEKFEKILQSHAQEPRVAVEERDGLEAVPEQPEPDMHEERAEIFLQGLEETNKQLTALKADLDGEVAFRDHQLKTIQETLSANEQIMQNALEDLTRRKGIEATAQLVSGELTRKMNELERVVKALQAAQSSSPEIAPRIYGSSDPEELEKLKKEQEDKQAEKLAQAQERERRKKERQEKRAKEQAAQSPMHSDARAARKEAMEQMRKIQALRHEGGDTQPVEHPTTSSALGECAPYGITSVALPASAPDKTEVAIGMVSYSAPLTSISELPTGDDSTFPVPLTADAIHQKAAAMVGHPIDPLTVEQPKPGEDFASLPAQLKQDIASAGMPGQSVLSVIPEDTEPVFIPEAFKKAIGGTSSARELAEMLGM